MTVQQKPSLSSLATDPLRNFVWQLTFTPGAASPSGAKAFTSGFMTVGGLGMTIDVIPYREGDHNTTTQKMSGQADFQPVVLSTGVIVGRTQDLQWIKQLFIVNQGSGGQTETTDYRCLVDIAVLAHPVTAGTRAIKARFRVYNAWPTSIAWSDLDAGANQLLIEQMSLAHEGIDPQIAASAGATEAPVSLLS
jgi:phage tail-like protein